MTNIAEVDPRRDRAKRVRKILGRVIREHIQDQGDDLAGFAIVSWDMRGGAQSGYLTEIGPVSESLMPAFVKDAIQRHLAAALAHRTMPTIIDAN